MFAEREVIQELSKAALDQGIAAMETVRDAIPAGDEAGTKTSNYLVFLTIN